MNHDTAGTDKQAVQNLAEHVYRLLTGQATERGARLVYVFAQSLLTPKQ